MKISNDVANVLADSRVEATELFLPGVQLERNLYLSVNKVLESIGGKWNRKTRSHIFATCPDDIVEMILQTGEYTDAKKEFQFFETPDTLAQELVAMANIKNGETILEPSAGKGQIAKYLPGCDCIELNVECRNHLTANGFNVVAEDFLNFISKEYDVIVANPPFSRQQDIDHVTHMIELANRCIVSVMSASVLFRDNKKTNDFRNLVYECQGTIEPLPDKSFSNNGTNVRTCLVVVDYDK